MKNKIKYKNQISNDLNKYKKIQIIIKKIKKKKKIFYNFKYNQFEKI